MRFYVGNFPYDTTAEDLRAAFAECGPVLDAVVIADRETGRPRGFGFVEVGDAWTGQALLLDGTGYRGRRLTVREANPRPERPARAPER